MSGMCKRNIQEKHASEPLSISQFLSAFLLLGIGTSVSLIFILLEHLYIKYLQNYVNKKNIDMGGCFSLLSQVSMKYTCIEMLSLLKSKIILVRKIPTRITLHFLNLSIH